jgi:hypothetical protein
MKALDDVARAALGGQQDPSITRTAATAQPFASNLDGSEAFRPVI